MVENSPDQLLQQMVMADGLSRRGLSRRGPLPFLSSNEPFPEHVFLLLSEGESGLLPDRVRVLRQPPSDDHHEAADSSWGTVRDRFFVAKERHSFLTTPKHVLVDEEPVVATTPKHIFPQDTPVEELRPAEKEIPRWKKAWLRRKKALRRETSGVFELISRRDETVITRVQSEGSARALSAPDRKPRRSFSYDRASGARGARGGAHSHRVSESQLGGLTTYYHLMKAKFPNVRGFSQDGSPAPSESRSTRDSSSRTFINRRYAADDPRRRVYLPLSSPPSAAPSKSLSTRDSTSRISISRSASA